MNTTYFEMNRILNHVFCGQSSGSYVYTSGSFALGLSTTVIAINGTGATEPSTAYGYARVAIGSTNSIWTDAASGAIETKTSISFPQSSSAWGTIRSIFLATDTTGGNIAYYYTLPSSFPVAGATTVTFASGSITVGME